MARPTRLVFLLVVVITLTVGVSAVDEFDIRIDGSYETPPENVSFEGDEFTVSSINAVRPGEEFTVHVTAPESEQYQINVYTADEQVQDFRTANGNETVTFDTDGLTPGSYVVAATDNGEFYAVHPVVVTDYRLNVTVPERVEAGSSFDTEVSLDSITGETTPGEVELVFWNDETRERVSTINAYDTTYRKTVSGLPNGTYRVYAVVIAEQSVDGKDNVVGVSTPSTIVVENARDDTPTKTPTTGSPTPTPETGTPTPTPSQGTPAPTATPTPVTQTETPAEDVITPGRESTPSDADSDGPVFGIPVTVLSLFTGLLLIAIALLSLFAGLLLARRYLPGQRDPME